jgi:hypothetical protein
VGFVGGSDGREFDELLADIETNRQNDAITVRRGLEGTFEVAALAPTQRVAASSAVQAASSVSFAAVAFSASWTGFAGAKLSFFEAAIVIGSPVVSVIRVGLGLKRLARRPGLDERAVN